MRGLIVVATGPLATLQDLGRPGYAHLGVPRSGAADRGALRQANRLVGNSEGAAGIEITLGGFVARARGLAVVAVTGPRTTVSVDGRPMGSHAVIAVPDGAELRVRAPERGCRNYLAVRGGVLAPQTLGSCATDTLSGLGPPPLRAGDELAFGPATGVWPASTFAPGPPPPTAVHELTVRPGPRADALADPAALTQLSWIVNAASNRIGVRLDPLGSGVLGSGALGSGALGSGALALHPGHAEQPSEGVPSGGVQVPPSGQPVLFLADHPVTGGYPIVAVLTAASVDLAAQLIAGDTVRLRI